MDHLAALLEYIDAASAAPFSRKIGPSSRSAYGSYLWTRSPLNYTVSEIYLPGTGHQIGYVQSESSPGR